MFVYAVFIGFALAGQISGLPDRYASPAATQAPPEGISVPSTSAPRDTQPPPPLPRSNSVAPTSNSTTAPPPTLPISPPYSYGTPTSAVSPPPQRGQVAGDQNNNQK